MYRISSMAVLFSILVSSSAFAEVKYGTLYNISEESRGACLKYYLEETNDRQICVDADPKSLVNLSGDFVGKNVRLEGQFKNGVFYIQSIAD